MNNKWFIWSGLALMIAGVVFIFATNGATRSSRLGLLVGGMIIALGLFRIWHGTRATPH